MKNLKHLLPVLTLLLLLATPVRAQLQPPDNSLLFNGMGQSVVITNFGSIVPTGEITVEVWIYATAISGQTAFAHEFRHPDRPLCHQHQLLPGNAIALPGFRQHRRYRATGPGRLASP